MLSAEREVMHDMLRRTLRVRMSADIEMRGIQAHADDTADTHER